LFASILAFEHRLSFATMVSKTVSGEPEIRGA